MRISSRPGEANVPAIILSVAVLILCLAGAYYLIAVVPTQSSVETSSSSSSSAMINTDGAMTDESSSSSVQLTAEQQAAYDGCINAANEAHTQRWTTACNEKKSTQESLFLACRQKNDEAYCTEQFGGYEDIDAHCDLGAARMTVLNIGLAAGKEACNRQYGL